MTKRTMTLAVLASVLVAACGASDNGDGAANGGSCPVAPTPLGTQPTLPPGFPIPSGVVLTSEREAGPSTILEGYVGSDLDVTYREYHDAFEPAGYDITFNEIEQRDAEVNFAGGGTTGQVKLEVECEGRTHVRITIRPA